jgi:hypothetical protein
MQFDTKSPVPKLLFSPVAPVPQEDYDAILKQRDSATAEAAIKLTVYQADEGDAAEVAQSGDEPKLREAAKKPEVVNADAAEVVKKWAKK